MDGQLITADRLLGAGAGDQLLGQGGGLAGRDHPAGHVPALYIDDHVQVVARSFRRAPCT
jgi:hypothetical protein